MNEIFDVDNHHCWQTESTNGRFMCVFESAEFGTHIHVGSFYPSNQSTFGCFDLWHFQICNLATFWEGAVTLVIIEWCGSCPLSLH